MSEFIVHSVPGSPFGRSVLATLEEKGAPYRLAPVALGTSQSPEHLARHPFGRVPVLEHDGFMLYETQAILRYLDRILPMPALTPADPRRAARMDQAMNINDWYLFQGVGNVIIFHRVIGPRMMGQGARRSGDRGRDAEGAKSSSTSSRGCSARTHISAATRISLADLMLAPAVEFFTLVPEWSELGAPHANLDGVARAHAGAAEHAGDDLGAGVGDGEGGVSAASPVRPDASATCSSISSLTRSGAWSAAKCPTPGSTSKR